MNKITNNILIGFRGDTIKLDLLVNYDVCHHPYFLSEHDAVYFGVMLPHQKFEDAIISMKFTSKDQEKDGRIAVTINPEYTVDLDPGLYYYQVKLRRNIGRTDEEVLTIANKTKFILND